MAQITNKPHRFESGVDGAAPDLYFGAATLDGTREPWASSPVGSEYVQKTATSQKTYRRAKGVHPTLGNRTDDWMLGQAFITATVTVAQFTDGGSTIGTYDLSEQIPVGAKVTGCTLVNVTGFAGDVSATLQIGDGTTVARYSTGTPSVFATAVAIDMGAVSGTAIHTTAATPRLTITTSTDFTLAVNNGSGVLTVRIYYLN